MWQGDQKCDVFKMAKRMVKTNHNIREQCIKNDDGVLAVSDEVKKQIGKVVMRFWTQILHAVGIIFIRQIQLMIQLQLILTKFMLIFCYYLPLDSCQPSQILKLMLEFSLKITSYPSTYLHLLIHHRPTVFKVFEQNMKNYKRNFNICISFFLNHDFGPSANRPRSII